MYAEYYMLQWSGVNNHVSYLFTTAAFSWALFLWVLQYKGNLPCGTVEIGKRHSANIYYCHAPVGAVVMMLFSNCSCMKQFTAPVVFVLAVFVSALLNATRKGLMRWCKGTRA